MDYSDLIALVSVLAIMQISLLFSRKTVGVKRAHFQTTSKYKMNVEKGLSSFYVVLRRA